MNMYYIKLYTQALVVIIKLFLFGNLVTIYYPAQIDKMLMYSELNCKFTICKEWGKAQNNTFLVSYFLTSVGLLALF